MAVVEDAPSLFRACDGGATLALLAKLTVETAQQCKMEEARSKLQVHTQCSDGFQHAVPSSRNLLSISHDPCASICSGNLLSSLQSYQKRTGQGAQCSRPAPSYWQRKNLDKGLPRHSGRAITDHPADASVCHSQHKLGLALKEFRLLHATSSRGSVPMNQLIFPPALKYLPVWSLGENMLRLQSLHMHTMPPCLPL